MKRLIALIHLLLLLTGCFGNKENILPQDGPSIGSKDQAGNTPQSAGKISYRCPPQVVAKHRCHHNRNSHQLK